MKEDAFDNFLILLAQIGPVALIVLNGWYSSLSTWFIPLDSVNDPNYEITLEATANKWLMENNNGGLSYYVFVDPECPCSKPTVKKLIETVANSTQPLAKVEVIELPRGDQPISHSLRELMTNIVSVPFVLVGSGSTIVYTGPVNSGNFCTTEVDKVLPMIATESATVRPIHNWLSKGCYCLI